MNAGSGLPPGQGRHKPVSFSFTRRPLVKLRGIMDESRYFTFDSRLGQIGITASPRGLRAITLPARSRPKAEQPPPPEFAELVDQIKAYCDGTRISFLNYDLDLSDAAPFQIRVWEATRLIPYGETRSYRWVAEQIGKPEATRAVGRALGKNPLPIIIPCHRVIASNSSLGGFGLGLDMKVMLLSLEKGRVLKRE